MGFLGEKNKKGLRLSSITELGIDTRNNILYKKIQDKLGCNDNLMERLKKTMPEYTRCKIETWQQDDGTGYDKAKTWITIDGKTEYDEIEDFGNQVTVLPTYIWEVMPCHLLTDKEREVEGKKGDDDVSLMRINFAYESNFGNSPYFLLYISGAKFEKKPEKENTLADMRFLEDKISEESIIFKLLLYDFNYLKPYHCDVNNSFVFPDDPVYYVPMTDHRKYSNWLLCSKEKSKEIIQTGIYWILEFHDFGDSFLPKLEK